MEMTIKQFLTLKDEEMATFIKKQSIQYQKDFIQAKESFPQLKEEERHAIIDSFCRKAPFGVIRVRLFNLGMKEE